MPFLSVKCKKIYNSRRAILLFLHFYCNLNLKYITALTLRTASAGLYFDMQYYSFTLSHIFVTATLVYNDAIFFGPFHDIITEFDCISVFWCSSSRYFCQTNWPVRLYFCLLVFQQQVFLSDQLASSLPPYHPQLESEHNSFLYSARTPRQKTNSNAHHQHF
jgi:hypothetical protein